MRILAGWSVVAGLSQLPEQEIPEYRKSWIYTSEDAALDKGVPEGEMNIFTKKLIEAANYAQSIQDPSRLNYVKMEFMWL